MALLGTFIETRSFSLASSATTSFSHGLGRAPHMVWASCEPAGAGTATGVGPLVALRADATNVTVQAYGGTLITGTACIAFFHSLIQ